MLLPTLFLPFVVVFKCLFLLSQPLGMEFLHLLPVSIRYIHQSLVFGKKTLSLPQNQ